MNIRKNDRKRLTPIHYIKLLCVYAQITKRKPDEGNVGKLKHNKILRIIRILA